VYLYIVGKPLKRCEASKLARRAFQAPSYHQKPRATLEAFWGAMAIVFGSADYLAIFREHLKISLTELTIPSQGKVKGKPYAHSLTGGRGGEKASEVLDRICGSLNLRGR